VSVIARLESQVAGALVRAGYSANGTHLVVGISGGPDSSALLHCLFRLRQRYGLRLHAAHLNHNFRGEEAEEDARFAASLASDMTLPATVERRDVLVYQAERRISSFEQAARELRYSFLAEVAEGIGASAVAVGHTSDDVAETVLLHILRGSGIQGLRGMSESSPWPFPRKGRVLRLFRPLLNATKADTESYCRELGKEYRVDSGNFLSRFTRNRVRLNLLPLLASEYNPRVREALVRLSRTAALELDYLEAEIERLWPGVAVEEDGAVGFDRPALVAVHPALQKLLFRKAYACLIGDVRRLGERHLDAMVELAQSKKAGRSLDLPNGLLLQRSYEYLRLSRVLDLTCPYPELEGIHSLTVPSTDVEQVVCQAGPWRVTLRLDSSGPPAFEGIHAGFPSGTAGDSPGQTSWTAYLHRPALGERLQVRTRQPGDRIQPLGMTGEKKLQDFLTDARVPREWRDRVPLLVVRRGIAWVVGYRIAHWARVMTGESRTTEMLLVTFEVQK
jgi:tRNA(Ile)-lysidine synthase